MALSHMVLNTDHIDVNVLLIKDAINDRSARQTISQWGFHVDATNLENMCGMALSGLVLHLGYVD